MSATLTRPEPVEQSGQRCTSDLIDVPVAPRPETANLQPRMTVKAAAKVMNVSERTVYMARRVHRSGRQDLIEACQRGEMSLNAALRAIDGQTRPDDGYTALCKAWNKATEDEQGRFLIAVGWQ